MPYKDKEKQKAASNAHYEANKAVYKKRAYAHNKITRNLNRKFVDKYLSIHGKCVDCGYDKHIRALDFYHIIGDKRDNVANLVNGGYSREIIKNEIRKCEIRCANCHRIKTFT